MDTTTAAHNYLESGIPFARNVLQFLENDPRLKGKAPQLPANRLSRAPSAAEHFHRAAHPLRVVSKKAFRAIPALSSRLRYHRLPECGKKPAIIAALELDIPVFAQHHIQITNVDLTLANGNAQNLADVDGPSFPMIFAAHDNFVSLYRLIPDGSALTSSSVSTPRSLEVVVLAQALVSRTCLPKIEIRWRTSVDFSHLLNPDFGRSGPSVQRPHRPVSLLTNAEPANNSNTSNLDIMVNIKSSHPIFVGQRFRWDILIFNQSSKPRRLGITMVPKHGNTDVKRMQSRPSSSRSSSRETSGVAEAVTNEASLHTMFMVHGPDVAPLVCLNADVELR